MKYGKTGAEGKEENGKGGLSVWRGSYVRRDSNLLWVCCFLFCSHSNFWWHLHFFPILLQVMSHPVQNPCITKQLDQKAPVMQQGSNPPHLLLRWEMEGERVSGRERQGISEAAEERGVQEQEYDSQINTATFHIEFFFLFSPSEKLAFFFLTLSVSLHVSRYAHQSHADVNDCVEGGWRWAAQEKNKKSIKLD